VTEQELLMIEEEIEHIQIGYDTVGYLSTNTADELINYAKKLIQVHKDNNADRKRNLNIGHLYNHENRPGYWDIDDE
jgi:hypothetical protein